MIDHASEAERLAREIAHTDPGAAAVVHALLAQTERTSVWRELGEYDDLPEQVNATYIFQYEDGREWAWTYVVTESEWMQFRSSGETDSAYKDPNELVDECVRWRYA